MFTIGVTVVPQKSTRPDVVKATVKIETNSERRTHELAATDETLLVDAGEPKASGS